MSSMIPPQHAPPELSGAVLYELYQKICVDASKANLRHTVYKTLHYLDIPKLTTRSGLREIYFRLREISSKLIFVFDAADRHNRRDVTRAIVAIWLCMCRDINICYGLMAAGIVARVLAEVGHDVDGRALALQLLSVVARHDLDGSSVGFLDLISRLVAFSQDQDDSDETEYTVVALSHAFETMYQKTAEAHNLPAAVLRPLADTTGLLMKLLLGPSPSHTLVVHALPVFLHRVRASSWEDLTHPDQAPLLDLVACLIRSDDFGLRAFCAHTFFDLTPPGQRILPPTFPATEWIHRSHHLSADSLRAVKEYGATRCVSEQYGRSVDAFVEVYDEFLYGDQDLFELGMGLASIILEGQYYDIIDDNDLPDLKFDELGLPYTSWFDCLPVAAKALRKHGKLDAADTLDIEYLQLTASKEEAAAFCKTVLLRNPKHAYARYKLCTVLRTETVSWGHVKQALELDGLSPYVRRQLLKASVTSAMAQAHAVLFSVPPSDHRTRRFATELYKIAHRDAALFLSESPPDCQSNIIILKLQMANTFVLRSQELSDDLSELQPYLEAMNRTVCLLDELGYDIRGSITAEYDLLIRHYRRGIKTWGNLIGDLNRRQAKRRGLFAEPSSDVPGAEDYHSTVEAALTDGTWRELCTPGLLWDFVHSPVHCGCDSSYLVSGLASGPGLYRCSHCMARTAVVKRCGGCQNVWYCDEECQREHWKAHKPQCRPRNPQTSVSTEQHVRKPNSTISPT